MPLELRAGIEISTYYKSNNFEDSDNPEDCYSFLSLSNRIKNELHFPQWRQMRQSELMILEASKKSIVSINRISKFTLRPPELRYSIDQAGLYYQWFKIGNHTLSHE